MNFYFLWSDILIWMLVGMLFLFAIHIVRYEPLRRPWKRVFSKKINQVVSLILATFVIVGLLDSIHFRYQTGGLDQDQNQIISLLDSLLEPAAKQSERTYSAPFALTAFVKEGRDYPRLQYGGAHLKNPTEFKMDIMVRLGKISLYAGLCILGFYGGFYGLFRRKMNWALLSVLGILIYIILFIAELMPYYHIFGTSKIGEDVLYQTLKSIRTGLIIGTVTTLFMLPFAVLFGLMAGYFRGWIDDVIQYIYTTLSSIPSVLLIAAAVLTLQVVMNRHEDWFQTTLDRSDARLLALCAILGITSWTGLCRLLRGEALKLREIEFVQAAKSLGVGHFKIIVNHLLPNVVPIILISVTLDFSGLVLAEAVLSYVGVGVDPSSYSWGTMINGARLEMARVPIVWWSLSAAFIFMFTLVLAANIFADSLRDAFDPRTQN